MSFETLILDNIEILGYNHQNNFFGDKSFHYSTTKILSIRGYVLDLTNTVGVKNIFNDTNNIKTLSQNFYNIIIKGQNFGIGKLTSLSFDNGNWVKSTKFNADIEIYQTANLQNLTSKEFANINLSNKRFDLIKNFNESFTIDFDQNKNILGGSHSIDIEYNADNKDLNVISLAQSLAAELLNNSIPTNLSECNYLTRPEGTYKVLNSESYDIINGKCGFNKTFSYSVNNNLSPYSINRNLNIGLDNNGIATINESCFIKGENDKPSLYDNALIGLNEQISGSYTRCNDFFKSYQNKFNIVNSLNSTINEKTLNINKFDGTIEYNIKFNNDKKLSQNYTFEYTSTLDRNEEFIWTVSEDGSIGGIGEKKAVNNSNIKYLNAETGWAIVKTGIESRLISFWSGQTTQKASTGIKIINKEITRSPFEGKIGYKYTYTDDPTIKTDLGDIKKLNISVYDDGNSGIQLAPIFNEYIIPNNKYTLIHNRDLKKQGTLRLDGSAEIALSSQTGIFNGLSYFNTLKSQMRNYYIGGTYDKYLESSEFTSDEIEQQITYREIYKYS